MPIRFNEFKRGQFFTLETVEEDEGDRVLEFLEELKVKRLAVLAGFKTIIDFLADCPPPLRNNRFVAERDGIYVIKSGSHGPTSQGRIYCFFRRQNTLSLCNGAVKKKDKADPADIDLALRLKRLAESMKGGR